MIIISIMMLNMNEQNGEDEILREMEVRREQIKNVYMKRREKMKRKKEGPGEEDKKQL